MVKKCIKIGREYGQKMDILNVSWGFPAGSLTEIIVEALKDTQNYLLG